MPISINFSLPFFNKKCSIRICLLSFHFRTISFKETIHFLSLTILNFGIFIINQSKNGKLLNGIKKNVCVSVHTIIKKLLTLWWIFHLLWKLMFRQQDVCQSILNGYLLIFYSVCLDILFHKKWTRWICDRNTRFILESTTNAYSLVVAEIQMNVN